MYIYINEYIPIAPMTIDPTKMMANSWHAARMESWSTSVPGLLNESSVRERTMATASLRTDSPKTIEKRSTYTDT